jgi:hypothetical protein
MGNSTRFALSALASGIMSMVAYLLPFTFLLYVFAPGFWLGDVLPASVVNALGGYLFPVVASALIWTFLIYLAWRQMARSRS